MEIELKDYDVTTGEHQIVKITLSKEQTKFLVQYGLHHLLRLGYLEAFTSQANEAVQEHLIKEREEREEQQDFLSSLPEDAFYSDKD